MPNTEHIFVFNPAAGRDGPGALRALREKLRDFEATHHCTVYETRGPGDAGVYARRLCESRPDTHFRFYACGGDGTLNEVLQGVMGQENAALSAYPTGSGNDFVKYYGGMDSFLDLSRLLAGREVPVDVMRVGDTYALNVVNFGFDTTVARTMARVKTRPIIGGKHAYTTGILHALVRAMRNHCTVWVDDECLNEKGVMLLCTVANGCSVGGSFRCAPRARDDDGLLEVCLVHPISHVRFMRLLPGYTAGTHLDDPRFTKSIVYRRGRRVHVRGSKDFAFSLDGEIVSSEDFTIEVCPAALRFIVPDGAALAPAPAEEALAAK